MKMRNGYRHVRVAVIGPTCNGKSSLLQSLMKTLATQFPHAVVQVVNTEGADATGDTALHRGVQPSKPGTREYLIVRFRETRLVLEISTWPGEDLLFERGINVTRLDQQLEAECFDLLVIAINTFQHDADLAAYCYLELCWNLQRKTGLSLGSICRLASKLLFFSVREEDLVEPPAPPKTGGKNTCKYYGELRELNAGFQQITDAQLRDGRLVRAEDAKLGLPLHECFRVDGCDDGDQIVDVLIRAAQTVRANSIELLNMRGIADRNPEDVVVAAVRADLLKFLPGVGEREFTRSIDGLFPDPKRVTIGQVVPQASLDLHIGATIRENAWLKNASDRAKPLIDAILNRCERFQPLREKLTRTNRLASSSPRPATTTTTPRLPSRDGALRIVSFFRTAGLSFRASCGGRSRASATSKPSRSKGGPMDQRIAISLEQPRRDGVPVPDHIGTRVVKVSSYSGEPVDQQDRTGAKEKLCELSSLSSHRVTLKDIQLELVLFNKRRKVLIPSLTLEGDCADWPVQIVRQVPELSQHFQLLARIREARTNPQLGKNLAQAITGTAH